MGFNTVMKQLRKRLAAGDGHHHGHLHSYKVGDELPVSQLSAGMHGRVVRIQTSNAARLHKLTSMGLLPGMPIELLQRFPSFLIKVGQTQLAIDKEMALAIYIRPHEHHLHK